MSIQKFLYSNKTETLNPDKSKYSIEVGEDNKHNLQIKCKKAALEIQYIRNFSHWPIARAKVRAQTNSLVYLDVRRSKRTPLKQKVHHNNKTIKLIDRSVYSNKRTVIKKSPNG